MKKFILSIAAIAALTACSKSHIEYNEPSEIAVAPVAQNITKGMVTTTTFPEETFNLWAYYKPVKNATIANWQADESKQQTYIDNKTFTKKGDGTWGGAEAAYYWPKDGSLMFAGYFPSSLEDVTYEFSSTQNIMTIPDYTPGMVTTAENDHSEDVMYFNMTAKSYTSGPVPVTFRHALSWITVKLAKSTDTPSDATITVNSVQFTEIYKTGTGTVNNSPVAPATNEIIWATAEGTKGILEVCPDDKTTTDTKENVVTLTTTATALAKEPIIIPQTMTGNLVVNYTITSEDGSSFTETKTIALRGMNATDSGTNKQLTDWQPAKHYTYTITIGTTEIRIQPSVDIWKDVTIGTTI